MKISRESFSKAPIASFLESTSRKLSHSNKKAVLLKAQFQFVEAERILAF